MWTVFLLVACVINVDCCRVDCDVNVDTGQFCTGSLCHECELVCRVGKKVFFVAFFENFRKISFTILRAKRFAKMLAKKITFLKIYYKKG
jgi:hypothetical protein